MSFRQMMDWRGAPSERDRVDDRVNLTLSLLRSEGVRRDKLRPSTLYQDVPDPRERRRIRLELYQHRYLSQPGGLCVYCGAVSVVHDHVPPLAQAYLADPAEVFCLYPACWVCNHLLGADRRVCVDDRAAVVVAASFNLSTALKTRLRAVGDSPADLRFRIGRMLVDGDHKDICQCRDCAAFRVDRL